MAPVSYARRRFDDDDDLYDDDGNGPYDKNYPGRRVIADRGRVRVPIQLTDGMPPEYRAAMSMSPQRNDASMHRPHQIVDSDSVEMRDARRAAEDAYQARNDFLRDAWRGPSTPMLPPLRDGQSARDQYIERLQSAYRTPTGRTDPASDIEALQRRWASPGATPGPGRRPAQDAAAGRAEADQAYAEYCARLQSAWKT